MADTGKEKISSAQINFGIFLVLLIVGGYAIADHILPGPEKSEISQSISNIEESLSPYAAKDKMHKLIVATDFKNSAPNNTAFPKIEERLKVEGTIVGGYLYVVASANEKKLETSDPANFDDVYVNLIELGDTEATSKEYGGHLVESKSLETPDSDNETKLLFSLANVYYLKSYLDSDKEVLSANWLQIFNDKSSGEKVVSFSSTLKKGVVKEFVIYYECLENTDCSISLY